MAEEANASPEVPAASEPEPEPEPEPEASEPPADEPEPASELEAAAAPAAQTLIDKESDAAAAKALPGGKLPDGWMELSVEQRILTHHPIVKVRAKRVRAQ